MMKSTGWARVWSWVVGAACWAVVITTGTAQAQAAAHAQGAAHAPARNVVLVMTDGLRWQELVRGADSALLTPSRYYDGRNVDALQREFLAPTPEARRRQLMPFVWGTLVPGGVLWGDRDAGSEAAVTNGFNFSYPGYSETLTGHGDPRIDSNDNKPNPNVTVLEWLNQQPGLEHQAAAFGAWAVINGIVNKERCGFPVNAGWDALAMEPMTPELSLVNDWKRDSPRIWDDEPFDAPVIETALQYVKQKHPRVLFVSLGETDDWAHGGNYGEYLLSAHRVDQYLERLWNALQAMPQYRNNTTLIFTTDHGRGAEGDGWRSHGQKLPESKEMFIAMMGAGVARVGVATHVAPVTQSQVAATMAKLLGRDWNAAEPKAGLPLPPVTSDAVVHADVH
ncbi:sulfatase-like hydrolase/transferase [Acidipila sp. EB88]|uniref:sulfatase-like hydrolase/transferase n=1 Tax=Acidipila sp. EB88 TaxID=2305226 RepID=UPI000F601D9A|nr:sulfatase-like hydrolase/transferase [Acidipila sp. EB88]RRA48654.1 AP protein [Acidipila sp. EB88]